MIRTVLLITLFATINIYGIVDNTNLADIGPNKTLNINQLIASQQLLIQKNFELTEENVQLKQEIQKINIGTLNQSSKEEQLIKDFSYMFYSLAKDIAIGIFLGTIVASAINKKDK